MSRWWARPGTASTALVVALLLTTGCEVSSSDLPSAERSSVSAPSTRAPSSVAPSSVAPSSVASSSVASSSGAPSSGASSATPSPGRDAGGEQTAPVARRVPVIVIDPGHSGRTIRSTTRHGLRDIDYPNYPEIYEMFDVSACVAKALRADGYRVTLTKTHALASVSHTQRAALANRLHADLAISVHDDHGVSGRFEHTYDQRGTRSGGSYAAMYRGTGSHRTVYDNAATAKKSQAYARAIAEARTKTQRHRVTVTQNSYDGRAPLEPGNLALVQLFSDVPWVYNEMGARTAGRTSQAMSISSEIGYATGLLAGVEAAVPLVAGRANPGTTSAASLPSCLVRQVEPTAGHLTRPTKYLPYHFARQPAR